jgi:hypothetical protein
MDLLPKPIKYKKNTKTTQKQHTTSNYNKTKSLTYVN